MRRLLVIVIGIIAVAAGGLLVSYGEIDPCRALAVERARRAENDSGLPVAGFVEPVSRMETSQMSTGECAGDLIQLWFERLSHHLH